LPPEGLHHRLMASVAQSTSRHATRVGHGRTW
jgi:hypothetical protein